MNKILKRNLPVVLGVLCFRVVGEFVDVVCPIKRFLKIPCPTCGVTRALCALAKCEFSKYAEYNLMAPFLSVAVLMLINIDIFKSKNTVYAVAYTVLSVNLIYYVVRLSLYGNGF